MKNFKKLLLRATLIGAIALPLSASAAVSTQTYKTDKLDFKTPIVSITNKDAQAKINETIQKDFSEKRYDNKEYDDAIAYLNYEVKYEDDDYLSIVITDYVYHDHAAHGMSYVNGIVFDKHTGNKIPLSYFLRVKNMEQIYTGIESGELKFFNGSMEETEYIPSFKTLFMSDSYYLGGNGSLYVIFQPYELGPYAYGATRVYFSREAVDKINAEYNY